MSCSDPSVEHTNVSLGAMRASAVGSLLAVPGIVLCWVTFRAIARGRKKHDSGKKQVARPKQRELVIVHFNDVYNIAPGKKEPVGGAARMAHVVGWFWGVGALFTWSLHGDATNHATMRPCMPIARADQQNAANMQISDQSALWHCALLHSLYGHDLSRCSYSVPQSSSMLLALLH